MGRFVLNLKMKIPRTIGGVAVGLAGWLVWGAAPADAAFEREAPNSCIECHRAHADPRLSVPARLWAGSVHAEVGNTCDGCHGGDPSDNTLKAMSAENHFYAAPRQEDIPAFCGKCHQELSRYFMNSPHGEAGSPTCIDCHGSHTIHRISIDIINPERCTQCHDYEPARKLRNILELLHGRFQSASQKIDLIEGFPTGSLKAEMDKVWKQLRQVRMISHTFDLERVGEGAKNVAEGLDRAKGEVERLVGLSIDRKKWGAVTIMIFFGLAVLAYFFNQQIKKED